jgi:gliding motility-associated protein GldC
MRIDLWTKDMPVDEMKRFYIECLGGIAQSVLNSTGDERMSNEINNLCDRLVEMVRKEK